MRPEDFFEIIDGIDDDIILDIPELSAEKPTDIIRSKGTPFWTIALSAACLFCVLAVGIFVAVKLHNAQPIDSGSDSSDTSSGESSDGSDSSISETSDQNSNIIDDDILSEIRLEKSDMPALDFLSSTDGLECKTLFNIRQYNGDSMFGRLYLTETGPVILVSSIGYDHYFWTDRDGNELDHVAIDFDNGREEIPDRDYPEKGIFHEDGSVLYYRNGKLQKTVRLPECRRADFTPDQLQYLYIDPERNKLTLYDLETESDIKSVSLEDLGYAEPWVMEFVNVVTPKLATVTLLEYSEATEYHGGENLRTFLLELPTLNVVQQLPDDTKLIALDDENFLMIKREKRETKNYRVSHAKLEDGEPTETETNFRVSNMTAYNNAMGSCIIMSPDKKVALLREWETNNEYGDGYMICRAVATDTMQLLWECRLAGGDTIPTGFFTSAVITDDAKLYLIGDTLGMQDYKPMYYIGMEG